MGLLNEEKIDENEIKLEPNLPKQKVNILLLTFLGIVLLVVTFILYAEGKDSVQMATEKVVTVEISENTESKQSEDDLQGVLFLSLNTITADGMHVPELTFFDVAKNTITGIPITSVAYRDSLLFQFALSSDALQGTFLGLPVDTNQNASESWNVYRVDLSNVTDYQSILDALHSKTTDTFTPDAEDYFREFPTISNDGLILYSSLDSKTYTTSKNSINNLGANNWSVYLISQDGTKTKLTNGLRAKWINSDTFAYLKDDGVHKYNISDNTDVLMYKSDEVLTIVNGFDVSQAKKYVALSSPQRETLTIFDLERWLEGNPVPPKVIRVTATNLAFAPNSKYLAMVALRADATEESTKQITRLEYLSLETLEFLEKVVPFEEDSIDGIYITGWQ